MVQEVVICIICSDWQKGKLTNFEAMRNLQEFANSTDSWEEISHYLDLAKKIKEEVNEQVK